MATVHAVGKRKSSVARVYLKEGNGKILINGRDIEKYFGGHLRHKHSVIEPFIVTNLKNKFDTKISVYGGGITGQAEAIKHAIARALAQLGGEIRSSLKKKGLLTRDSRVVERKKPGKPKARKSYQFSKR